MIGRKWVIGALAVVAVVTAGCAHGVIRESERYTGKGSLEVAEAKHAIIAGNLEGARRKLDEALARGASAEAHYYLALISLQEEGSARRDVALNEAGKSIEDYPSPQAFLLRGSLLEPKKPDEAIQCYNMGLAKAAQSHPSWGMLHRNLAAILARRGETDAALSHMKSYVSSARPDRSPLTDEDCALWGYLLYQTKQDDLARATWSSIHDRSLRKEIASATGLAL